VGLTLRVHRQSSVSVLLVSLRRHHCDCERGPQCVEDRPPRQRANAQLSGQQPVGEPQARRGRRRQAPDPRRRRIHVRCLRADRHRTWLRRWVRYEIARAVIDGRGLLGVHLNSIRHHHTKTPHTRGLNPLDYMAVGKVQEAVLSTPRYYLFERQPVPNGGGGYSWLWNRYSDYTSSVTLPPWLADPIVGYVTPLSQNASVYDYISDDGHRSIGSWIDNAAQRAGR